MRSQEEKQAFVESLKQRIKRWVIRVISLCENLPKTSTTRVINFQLLKSSTSTGANHRAACRARSDNEFYAKMCIAVEEADESLYWLEIIEESNVSIDKKELQWLIKENEEILKILVSAKVNAKRK